MQDDEDAYGVVQGDFGYIANGKVFFPAKHSYLRRTKATAATAYHENVPFLRWMWGGLVRPASSSDKDALSKMTKWSPIPPVLYVDTKDIKDYEAAATQVANRGSDTSIDTTKAEYTNRNRPSAMTHVLTHFFLDPSFAATAKSSYGTGDVTGAPTVAEKSTALSSLIAVDQAGVLAAIRGLKTGNQTTTSRVGAGVLDVYGATTTLGSVTRQIIVQVLTSIVQNGGDPSLFKELASAVEASDVQYLTTGGVSDAVADLIIDAYILELDNWMATRGDETTFGTGTGAYSTNAHLGYWLPYLRLLSAKQIATRAIEEDGLINITASSQIKVLGLLKAATNSKAGSNLSSDSAARITGINAFFDAGVQKAFVDLAWTERGVNSFTNFSGTKYEAQLAGLIDNFN